MCHKRFTCPEFERRTVNGIKDACYNCEYVKKFERMSKYCKVGLLVAIIAFIVTTCQIY